MLLYETEIKEKLENLPDDLQKEVLDFVEYLSAKYPTITNKDKKKKKVSNPFQELSGFVSLDSSTSKDIDKLVYNL